MNNGSFDCHVIALVSNNGSDYKFSNVIIYPAYNLKETMERVGEVLPFLGSDARFCLDKAQGITSQYLMF